MIGECPLGSAVGRVFAQYGTPRGLQGRLAVLIAVLVSIYHAITVVVIARSAVPRHRNRWLIARLPQIQLTTGRLESGTCTTGC